MLNDSPCDGTTRSRAERLEKIFASIGGIEATERWNDHGGHGPILFRRMFKESDFKSPIDFIDYTVIPPASTIGRHDHDGNEEVYFIVSGSPLMSVNGETARLHPGSFSVVRSGEWHQLMNDTAANVEILVIQVRLA